MAGVAQRCNANHEMWLAVHRRKSCSIVKYNDNVKCNIIGKWMASTRPRIYIIIFAKCNIVILQYYNIAFRERKLVHGHLVVGVAQRRNGAADPGLSLSLSLSIYIYIYI